MPALEASGLDSDCDNSFGEVRSLSRRLAHGLVKAGYREAQDTVLFFAQNSIWYPTALWALQAATLVRSISRKYCMTPG